MGRGIGTRAVAGGHQVQLADRDQAKAQKLAGEIVVFAVYYPAIKDAVQ